jgi:Ca2+-binding RTX toxin-like protein
MRPFLFLLAIATLTAGLTVTAAPATAAAATCNGVPATIEASGVPRIDGTEGRDVIVADDVNAVHALGGDDLICLTGSTPTFLDAGAGDDVVVASGRTGRTTAHLGEGDDTYVGSTSRDDVDAGTPGGIDSGRDVVATGPAGDEEDFVTSGEPGLPNPDDITAGWMTLSWAGVPTATSKARGGTGSSFALRAGRITRLRIDVPARSLTLAGSSRALALRGFTVFGLSAPRDLERFTFRGSRRGETLLVPAAGTAVVRAAMGGGADTMQVGTYARGSSLSGGDGRDVIDVLSPTHLDLDLREERLVKRAGGRVVTIEVNGFEDAFVRANTAQLIGTRGPNRLSTDACRTRIEGLGGRDRLRAFDDTGFGRDGRKCMGQDRITAHLFGGPGNDTLQGSRARDLLIGGTGRDRADGNPGRDTCQAEVRRSCEVVRR